jgi:GNAT superfamily N-acetyltransferase
MDISCDRSRLDLDVIYEWLRGSYWSPNIRRDVVERAFASSLVAGAYQDGVQVGVARAVTDRATFAWLCDVFVAEPARGRGVGTALVRALIEHPELTTLRRWALATRDAHGVYRKLGFTPADPSVWMALAPDPAGWQVPGAAALRDRLPADSPDRPTGGEPARTPKVP